MVSEYYSALMNKEELIGYCDIHCETERALFPKAIVAQMIDYAGCPEDWSTPDEVAKGNIDWYSMHEDMKGLVKLAKANKQS